MRLDRFICKSTDLTRAEAIRAIHAGNATINGDINRNEAVQVHENNTIKLNGQTLIARKSRYLLLHKPAGTICSNIDERHHPSVFNYLDIANPSELHIVGRLDVDTTGLLLLTDDGRWSFNIISPDSRCEKVYRVGLRDELAEDVAPRFQEGVQLHGEKKLTQPAKLDVIGSREVFLTITEGRHHQVKRMFAAVGNKVVSLHREKIGDVTLDTKVGNWRHLTAAEVASL